MKNINRPITFLKAKIFNKAIIKNNAILIMFALTVCTILLALKFNSQYYIILLPIIAFFIYDINFRLKKESWKLYGRDYKTTLDGIRAAIQYTTFLFGFIGIALGQLLNKGLNEEILVLFYKSQWLQTYVVSIILIIALMLLFIPVVYTKRTDCDNNKCEPSSALKNYYFLILFLQKTFVILTVYLLLLIAKLYFQL